jgi:hypothetical protein
VRARIDPFRSIGLVALLALSVSACGSGAPAATLASAPPGGPVGSTGAGESSGDQGLAAAATAYLAAATAAKAANAALDAQYSGSLTLAQGRAYYRAAADVDGTFLAAVRAISFPPAVATAAAAVINRVSLDQALDVQGSTVVTAAGMELVEKARPADLAAVALAGNQLRAALGLPAAP